MRFRVRTLMLAVALVATLAGTATWVARCLRVRDEARRQVVSLQLQLFDVDFAHDLCEAARHFDPDGQTLPASMTDDERKAWLAEPGRLRRAREDCKALLLRWRRLADRPWEGKPADLPRVD